jgi:hypothetical protein
MAADLMTLSHRVQGQPRSVLADGHGCLGFGWSVKVQIEKQNAHAGGQFPSEPQGRPGCSRDVERAPLTGITSHIPLGWSCNCWSLAALSENAIRTASNDPGEQSAVFTGFRAVGRGRRWIPESRHFGPERRDPEESRNVRRYFSARSPSCHPGMVGIGPRGVRASSDGLVSEGPYR